MSTRPATAPARLETWCWTGPIGHLLAGSLDIATALSAYLLPRARRRASRWVRARARA